MGIKVVYYKNRYDIKELTLFIKELEEYRNER